MKNFLFETGKKIIRLKTQIEKLHKRLEKSNSCSTRHHLRNAKRRLSELQEEFSLELERKQHYRELYQKLFRSDYEFDKAWNEFLRKDALESEARTMENLWQFIAKSLVEEVQQ